MEKPTTVADLRGTFDDSAKLPAPAAYDRTVADALEAMPDISVDEECDEEEEEDDA